MKNKSLKTAITPTRQEAYAEWYQSIIQAAELAENSPVRGCMIIKPWGYALWENMQRVLDEMFKASGHKNAYFPMFIPLSYLEKEAQHVAGFAKECAVVTHHRLETNDEGKLVPAGELAEPLIVRPTSEIIIGEAFSRWIKSYRDLPLLINQWANVVRWEMRTRLFLRTSEFLWQEGHTAHSTDREALDETLNILKLYQDFVENWMAMPVIAGEKTESERFPGAVQTFCIEAMMQDRKALQAGTCHFLGQNFAHANGIQFLNQEGQLQHAWTTSWGVSTRLVGGLIMTHSDDNGLVLPPKLAPAHVMLLPVLHKDEERQKVMDYCQALARELREQTYAGRKIEVLIDDRDLRGGDKFWEAVKKGIPLIAEVGPRDIAKDSVFLTRRDQDLQDKQSISRQQFVSTLIENLEAIHHNLFKRAKTFLTEHTRDIKNEKDFYAFFTPEYEDPNLPPPIHGGFAITHFCGDPQIEAKIKNDLSVTIRCIPLENQSTGRCPFSGKESAQRVVWAKSY